MLAFPSFSSSEMMLVGMYNEKWYQISILEFKVSFAPMRPAGFVNFCGPGRGRATLAFLRGGAACFSAGRASLYHRLVWGVYQEVLRALSKKITFFSCVVLSVYQKGLKNCKKIMILKIVILKVDLRLFS